MRPSYGGAGGGSVAIFGPPAALPKDTTEAATEVLQSTATLSGSVDPDGSGPVTGCEFQWGVDARYLDSPDPLFASRLPDQLGPNAVTAKLTGLEKTTTYHYRLVTTSAGGVQTGHDSTFTTADFVAECHHRRSEPGDQGQRRSARLLHRAGTGHQLLLRNRDRHELRAQRSGRHPRTPASRTARRKSTRSRWTISRAKPNTTTGLSMTNSLGTARGDDRTFFTPPAVDRHRNRRTSPKSTNGHRRSSTARSRPTPTKSTTTSNGARPRRTGTKPPPARERGRPRKRHGATSPRSQSKASRKAASTTTGSSAPTRRGPRSARTGPSRPPNRPRSATSAPRTSPSNRPT